MTETLSFGPLVVTFDDRVLRPRPWTIAQSLWAAELLGDGGPGTLLELCAGAGQIGLALAALVPGSIVLVDADDHACSFARANAAAADLGSRVDVRNAPLESALAADERFGCILADPPWVRTKDVKKFPLDPQVAINGGTDGLDLARVCVSLIGQHLAESGVAILQLGDTEQVATICSYLDSEPQLGLRVLDVRVPGNNGVLVRLGRRR